MILQKKVIKNFFMKRRLENKRRKTIQELEIVFEVYIIIAKYQNNNDNKSKLQSPQIYKVKLMELCRKQRIKNKLIVVAKR